MKSIIVVLSLSILCVRGANILGVFPTPSISHQVVFRALCKELSLRGHHVTSLTPNPLNDKSLTNLTEIDMSHADDILQKLAPYFGQPRNQWFFMYMVLAMGFQDNCIEEIMEIEQVQIMLNDPNTHFDLVLFEPMCPGLSAFSDRFKCPLISMFSMEAPNGVYRFGGNPTHPVIYPDVLLKTNGPLSFFKRVDSFIFDSLMILLNNWLYHPVDRVIKKHFGPNTPFIKDLESNFSMLFVNRNPFLHKPRPLNHNVVEIGGGIHLTAKKPLPQDLQNFMDNAHEGVIYFSLGSNVKSINLEDSSRQLLMGVFSELPYKILWKFENTSLPNKPENVQIRTWFPQQDLLGHPNLKLFITQAGLQSTEEAIYNDVPMLALPFIADQHAIASRIDELKIGKFLDFSSMGREDFKGAILEIIRNQRYKENVKKIHQLMEDQPMTGLEKAVWWTEYVIRHKGAPYFESPLAQTSWFQYLMVDVITFLLTVMFIVLYLCYKIASIFLRVCFRRPIKVKVQ